MRHSPGLLCLVLLALVCLSRARYSVKVREVLDEGHFYGMPQAPQQALQPAESPSVLLSNLHLTGSLPEEQVDGHVRDWDPEIKSFLVRSKQPGTGCHQLTSKQPLQQRPSDSDASNYFFRGGSSAGGAGFGQGEAFSEDQAGPSLQEAPSGQADGSPPCADLPFNIFAALSKDGYVRHTALNGDQPEFK